MSRKTFECPERLQAKIGCAKMGVQKVCMFNVPSLENCKFNLCNNFNKGNKWFDTVKFCLLPLF